MLFHRELEKNLHVCHHCGHHLRLSARQRLEMLFDDGVYIPYRAAQGAAPIR